MPAIKTEKQRYARGLKRRKQVLGAKYVAERLKNRHPFTDEFQSLITRYAWGELWTRPKFDDRTRRLLVLAMLVAMKSWEEFELHTHRCLSGQFVDVMPPAIGFAGFFAGAAVAAVSTGVDDSWAVVGFGMIVEQRSWNSALALVS